MYRKTYGTCGKESTSNIVANMKNATAIAAPISPTEAAV